MDIWLEMLESWLEPKQFEQINAVKMTLKTINSALCKAIFIVLNEHRDITCPQIAALSVTKIDIPRAFAILKELEKLNFVLVSKREKQLYFTLNKAELINYIGNINDNFGDDIPVADNKYTKQDVLELNTNIAGMEGSVTLNYRVVSHLIDCMKCLCNTRQQKILKSIIALTHKPQDKPKPNYIQKQYCIDKELYSYLADTQYSVSRDLGKLSQVQFINRISDGNNRINSINLMQIQKMVLFINKASEYDFSQKIEQRRSILPSKPVKIRPQTS